MLMAMPLRQSAPRPGVERRSSGVARAATPIGSKPLTLARSLSVGYNRDLMSRRFTTSLAAILVLAVAVAPLARDQCLASCEMQPLAGPPACHHSASVVTTPQLRHGPAACGHDGNATTVTAARRLPSEHCVLTAHTAIPTVAPMLQQPAVEHLLRPHAPPGSRQRIGLRSPVLRI